MKRRSLVLLLALAALAASSACGGHRGPAQPDPLLNAYDVEQDWNDSSHSIPLNYQQAQGKRIFYEKCVWCHADSTPAGPSNRSNLNPTPPLANDGATFNALSEDFLRNVITVGGGAMGKSAIMPAWGRTLTQGEVEAVITYIRAVAQPPYRPPARPGPRYSTR